MSGFGECVWLLTPQSAGKDKLDSRWESGVSLGTREKSGEVLVGKHEGVNKITHFRRKLEDERWSQEEFATMRGVPREPEPGREHIEIKLHFQMKGDAVKVPEPQSREPKPRRVYITRRDIIKYGSPLHAVDARRAARNCQAITMRDAETGSKR